MKGAQHLKTWAMQEQCQGSHAYEARVTVSRWRILLARVARAAVAAWKGAAMPHAVACEGSCFMYWKMELRVRTVGVPLESLPDSFM